MRERFRGWYRPNAAERTILWHTGIVALDASFLLHLYRVRPRSRNRVLDLLDAVQAQLWVPHQAALEYQRNRLNVISEQDAAYEQLRAEAKKAQRQLVSGRRRHPVLEHAEFERRVDTAFGTIHQYINESEDRHPAVLGADDDDDEIRKRLDAVLGDAVGQPLERGDEWSEQARRRLEDEVPPGYKDWKKGKSGGDPYGDLIVWSELLEEVRSRAQDAEGGRVPVVLGVEDQKEDWWRTHAGRRLGPRPELIEEMMGAGGIPFWAYSLESFLNAGAEHLGWELEDEDYRGFPRSSDEGEDSPLDPPPEQTHDEE
jgi:hypothetical protein